MVFAEDTEDIWSHWLALFNKETQVTKIIGKFVIYNL